MLLGILCFLNGTAIFNYPVTGYGGYGVFGLCLCYPDATGLVVGYSLFGLAYTLQQIGQTLTVPIQVLTGKYLT